MSEYISGKQHHNYYRRRPRYAVQVNQCWNHLPRRGMQQIEGSKRVKVKPQITIAIDPNHRNCTRHVHVDKVEHAQPDLFHGWRTSIVQYYQ